MTDSHRLVNHNKRGRPKKLLKLRKQPHKSLGGIPMRMCRGKPVYAQRVPKNYSEGNDKEEPHDFESQERQKATLPVGSGDFIRRHIYEMRFGIRSDETPSERQKREYLSWIEERLK